VMWNTTYGISVAVLSKDHQNWIQEHHYNLLSLPPTSSLFLSISSTLKSPVEGTSISLWLLITSPGMYAQAV
jgi:hypothetical protein